MPGMRTEVVESLLDTWPVARLATLTPTGDPHLVPIVFARAVGALWSPVDGKPKATHHLARLAHIAAHPRICVLLDHYDSAWQTLWWIRIDATATLEGAHPEAEAALRAKYPQYRETPLFEGTPTLIRIDPLAVTGWSATPALPSQS